MVGIVLHMTHKAFLAGIAELAVIDVALVTTKTHMDTFK